MCSGVWRGMRSEGPRGGRVSWVFMFTRVYDDMIIVNDGEALLVKKSGRGQVTPKHHNIMQMRRGVTFRCEGSAVRLSALWMDGWMDR